MAAVTSYVLLDFADEIIAQQPDAVVIYTGHNEYLGIGGVGSSLASARSPTLARGIVKLRRLHLYRALERAFASLGPAADPLAARDGTLMSRVAAERSIPLGSPLYEQGLTQFRGNLARLLQRYRAAGVPVFIGTLASNERDQPPFASAPPEAGESSALVRFERARELEASGDHAAARAEYLAASDRDELRFRAPQAFNEVIRETAAAAGATVVDVQAAFAAASSNGIIGAGLMLEHVHPNVEGYFQLASAYFPQLVQWAGPAAVVVDDATARVEIPVTEVDRLHGEYRVAMLKNDWPFVAERRPTTLPPATTRIEEIAQSWFAGRLSWLEAMNEALVDVPAAREPRRSRARCRRTSPTRSSTPRNRSTRRAGCCCRPSNPSVACTSCAAPSRSTRRRSSIGCRSHRRSSCWAGPTTRLRRWRRSSRGIPEDSRAKYWLDEMRRAAQSR